MESLLRPFLFPVWCGVCI